MPLEISRWIIMLLFGVPALLLISVNWLLFVSWTIAARRGRGRRSWFLPAVGGVAGAIACLAAPWPGVWRWSWLPLMIEPILFFFVVGCVPHVVARLTGRPSPFDPPRQ